jgi:hypothetical protein
LIGRLNQPAADAFLPLRAFKPSSSDSADRGHSIIQVIQWIPDQRALSFMKIHFVDKSLWVMHNNNGVKQKYWIKT